MEKDLLTFINEESEEKFKLLSVIDNQYIIYTNLNNNNPTDNITIIKVKSLNELEIIPITNEEIEMVEEKYLNILK